MSCHAVRALVAFGTAVALAGCAGTTVVNHSYQQSYTPGEWRAYPLPVYVQGTPFAVPHTEIVKTVTDAMQGTTLGVPTQFIPATRGTSPAYRVVMVFTPPPGLDGYALCTARPEPPAAAFGVSPATRVELLGALCRGSQAISTADGTVPTAGGPDSAIFQNGISQFAMALLPPRTDSKSSPPDHNRTRS